MEPELSITPAEVFLAEPVKIKVTGLVSGQIACLRGLRPVRESPVSRSLIPG